MLNIGAVLQNRYRIDAVLGQGGMGVVYRAFELNLQRVCVVKELLIQLGVTQQTMAGAITQFQQEAMTLAKLNHVGLPRVTDYFREGNSYCLVMDYVEGRELQSMLGSSNITEADVLRYATQLLSILEYIHGQNVLHRDIKPSNIIIQPTGHLMLVDFGLAKQANLKTVQYVHGFGTEYYSPPEQYSGGTDTRSDLYSVGATLYHLLAAQAPTSAATRMSGAALTPLNQLRPDLSPNIVAAITKALQMDRNARYQSATEFKAALQMATRPITPPKTSVPATQIQSTPSTLPTIQPTPPMQNKRGTAAVGALVAGAVAVLACGAALLYVVLSRPSAVFPTPSLPVAQPTQEPAAPEQPTQPKPTEAPQTQPDTPTSTTAPTVEVVEPTSPPISNQEPTVTPAPFINIAQRIGYSANGGDIFATQMGDDNGSVAIVVVGRIAGEQFDTSNTVNELQQAYQSSPSALPKGVVLYLIENINPSSGSKRVNANGVDLNRNWQTYNWRQNAPGPGGTTVSGGRIAFSEPETQALRDLLLKLKRNGRNVRLIVLHSSQTSRFKDVYPGYTDSGVDSDSARYSSAVASQLGFKYSETGSTDTTGEAIAWCAENGIPSVDIFWSRDVNRPSVRKMMEVINVLAR